MKTKKRHIALLLLAILAIAGVVGAVFANSIVLGPANSVELTQVESFGDPAFARGLELNMMLRDGSSLYWDAKGSFGKTGPEFETRHRYSQEPKYLNPRDSIFFYPDLLQIPEIQTMVEDAAATADMGNMADLKLDLSEYTEYLPLSIWADRVSSDLISGITFVDRTDRMDKSNDWNKVLDGINDAANSFLKIPVPKGTTAQIHIFVNFRDGSTGKVDYNIDVNLGAWAGMDYGIYRGDTVCSGPLMGDAYYVYVRHGVAGSKLPGGPGIYRIPLEDVGHEELPMIQNAVRVCPFDEGEEVFASSVMQDPAALVVITEKEGALKEYVLGGQDGSDLQIVDLGIYPDPGKFENLEQSIMEVHFYKDYNALHIPGERWIVVQRATDGTCRTFSFPETAEDLERDNDHYVQGSRREHMSAVFDGKRLAVAGALYEPQPGNPYGATRFSGFRLSVYTEDGLGYYGAWSTSLKDDPYLHPPYAAYGVYDHLTTPSTYDRYWIDQIWN